MLRLAISLLGLSVSVIALYSVKRRSNQGASGSSVVRVIVGAAVTLVVVLAFLVFVDVRNQFRPIPSFPSLAAHPDPSLHGTVAYNALPIATPSGKQGCVDVAAASGGASKQLFCADQPKAMGAELQWLADGRLQATDQYQARWRKVIDVRTGVIENFPGAKVTLPLQRDSYTVPGPDGKTIVTEVGNGTMKVSLIESSTTRVLVDITIPNAYGLQRPVWSPDGKWILAEDSASRLLVITTGEKSTTRILVENATGPAVTGTDYLTTTQ